MDWNDERWVRHEQALASIVFSRICLWHLSLADEFELDALSDEWCLYELLIYEVLSTGDTAHGCV